MRELKVYVIERANRPNWYLKWTDPVTGEPHERSSRTADYNLALKKAGELEAELLAGGVKGSGLLRWVDFVEIYDREVLRNLGKGTRNNVFVTLDFITTTMNLDTLGRINREWLREFRRRIPSDNAYTQRKYLSHLKTALSWAFVEAGCIDAVPPFPTIKIKAKGGKHMKGRPITLEEFERMIAAIPETFPTYKNPVRIKGKVVVAVSTLSHHLLWGLWHSGLRLGEALSLTWDQWEDGIRIDFEGDELVLLIDGDDQKNGEMQVYPVVDEFAEYLLKTPEAERRGWVFAPQRCGAPSRCVDTVSNWLVEVGVKAGVKVDERNGKPVYASAHDLRRSFGYRWSWIVPSQILKELMRHDSITTTEKFYLGRNARDTIRALRQYRTRVS